MFSQLLKYRTLHNSKKGLVSTLMSLTALVSPANSPLGGCFSLSQTDWIGCTFIQGHDDVGAKSILNIDGFGRRQTDTLAVYVGGEGYAVVVNLD